MQRSKEETEKDATSTATTESLPSEIGVEAELPQHLRNSTVDWSSMIPPYGLTILTILYLVIVLVLQYASPVECLFEPCSLEGVDTTVLTFGTDDFLTAILLMGLALHLSCHYWVVHDAAILTQWSMAIAFIFMGIGHSINSNRGFDDNVGEKHFYVTWTIVYALMILSVEETYRWNHCMIAQYEDLFQRSC